MKVSVTALTVPWRAPLAAAHGEGGSGRPLLLLTLTGADGVRGYGEAAPLQAYDGVSVDEVRSALERCSGLLAASDGGDRSELLEACSAAAGLPEALAAVDMALWDLAGRRAGKPVWELLGASPGGGVAVNATIGGDAPARAADEAGAAVAAGFRCVKVKVGVGDDRGRVAAVRDVVGPDVAIRVDANGAWSVPQAVEALGELGAYDLEVCEEPAHGLEGLAEVSRVARVPVALDESARDPGWRSERICDAVCLKVARCGGITGLLDDAAAARHAGYRLYVASTLDGPLGIAAALHAAAAVGPDLACGLATLGRFSAPDPLPVQAGQMSLPPGPGLGDGLLDWYPRS